MIIDIATRLVNDMDIQITTLFFISFYFFDSLCLKSISRIFNNYTVWGIDEIRAILVHKFVEHRGIFEHMTLNIKT